MDNKLKELREGWYNEARQQTIETLSVFIQKLADYKHDYNTICYACGAAALAAATAIDRSPSGGITGFQAGAIMWEFVSEWLQEQNKPMRLIKYENLLYPQYNHDFDKVISQETADWLRDQAKLRLSERQDSAHPAVIAHWEAIVAGNLPFGFRIEG